MFMVILALKLLFVLNYDAPRTIDIHGKSLRKLVAWEMINRWVLGSYLHTCLLNFIDERYNLNDPSQSAYRTNHSIETALLRVNNDLLCDMDKGKVSALLLLDLSAAFDTVDHKILISRLNDIGICGSALNWCRSYLDNRIQFVRRGDESSDHVRLTIRSHRDLCSVHSGLLYIIHQYMILSKNTTSDIITMLMTFNSSFLLTPTQNLSMLASQCSKNVWAKFVNRWNAISWNLMMTKLNLR